MELFFFQYCFPLLDFNYIAVSMQSVYIPENDIG